MKLKPVSARISRLLLSFALLATMSPVFANDPTEDECEKPCPSCEEGSSCEPSDDAYGTSAKYKTDPAARNTSSGDEEGSDDCEGSENNDTSNGGQDGDVYYSQGNAPANATSPGVTPRNYRREGIRFSGVRPDYVKYENVTQTVNGVDKTIRKPSQFPAKHSTVFYSDLESPGMGYQVKGYPNSRLGARDANGLRAIPAGAEPSSVTIYRNPDFDPQNPYSTQGRLDIIHKQRHPQTGAWVTRTIRKSAPQGNNTWTTAYYLGDPTIANSAPLQAYRKLTITRTPHPDGTETTREITEDLNGGGYVITKDITATYAFYKHGEPVKLSETRHTGTGFELTTISTYHTNAADRSSFNKPATIRRSDGKWSNITYQGSPVTGVLLTRTVSGWLNNPAPAVGTAPDENANRVVIEIEAKNETGTFSREEKIQGVLVSKTWGEKYKDNTGMLIKKTRQETGSTTLTTIRTGWSKNNSVPEADRGRLKSVQNPDGTVELHSHVLHGDNLVTTIDKGVGSLSGVTDGTRTVSTYTKHDTVIKEVVSDIASGIVLSTREAIAFDSNEQPARWAYDNNPDDYSEFLKGCCGIDSERGRDGITTTYTRDGLKRPLTAVSQGVTLTYTYGSTTIGGTAFPTENVTATADGLTLDKGTTVYDLAGNVIQQISPDLDGDGNMEITTTTHDFTARTTTTTNPDGGTIIQTNYADGQSKSTTGTATAPAFYQHTTHAGQGGGPITATAPASTGPWTRIYQNLVGSTLKTTFDGGAGEAVLQTNSYDNLGRLVSTMDADGVSALLAYNAKGEPYRCAIDLNQNGQIDAADRVTDTLEDVLEVEGFGPALRTRTLVYDDFNNAITIGTGLRSPDGLATRQETLGVTNPATSTSASYLDRADGSWTDTTIAPDGTKQGTTYSHWLAVTKVHLDTGKNVIESVTTGYDALHRPETLSDSRTAPAVVTRTAYHASNGLVVSVTEDLVSGADRVTAFAYDSMGRRTSTTLPDNSVTHTTYWPTGQEKATWGSQTNPTVKLFDTAGRLNKLRTFRNANLALAPDETTAGYDETTWTYNNRGQLERKEYADGKGTNYTYTPGGKLHTRTWARTVGGAPLITTYGYSAAGELITTDYSDTTPDVTTIPDKLGRQQSVTNGIAQSVFTYDTATLALDYETISYNLDGQPGFEFTRVLDRSTDTLGRETGFQLKNGSTIENEASYTYQAATGRLYTVSDGTNTFTYSYVPNSNLIDAVAGPAHTVTNTWEPDRDVLDLKQNQIGTTTVSGYDYTVNVLGQRTAVATAGTAFPATPAWEWGYDSLGQVTSADHSTNDNFDRAYQYDTIGNRIEARDGVIAVTGTSNYTANALHQYTAVGSLSPIHDDDGNAVSYPLPADPGNLSTLAWDAENRLISATINGATTTYLYDSQSRRIAKMTGGNTTLSIYDGFNCIAEYSGATLARTYTWGLDHSGNLQGVGGLLAVKQGSAVHYPTFDGNGNVSEYLASDGSIDAHFEYDPFGNTVVDTDNSKQFNYRFSTKPINFETGLYYYGYRYYDPVTGRWPSRDPIEEQGGLNLFSFVQNSGIDEVDLLGLIGIADLLSDDLLDKLLKQFGDKADLDKFISGVDKIISGANLIGKLRELIVKQGKFTEAIQFKFLDNFLLNGKKGFRDPLNLSVSDVIACRVKFSLTDNAEYLKKLNEARLESMNSKDPVIWTGNYDVPAKAFTSGTLGNFQAITKEVTTCCEKGECHAKGVFTVKDRYDFNYDKKEAQKALQAYLDQKLRGLKVPDGPFEGRTIMGELKTVIISRVVSAKLGKEFDVTSDKVPFAQGKGDSSIVIQNPDGKK